MNSLLFYFDYFLTHFKKPKGRYRSNYSASALFFVKLPALLFAIVIYTTALDKTASAEGYFQIGTAQRLYEYTPGRDNEIGVDIVNPGEWINISACGISDTDVISVEIRDPFGALLSGSPHTLTNSEGKVSCASPLDTPISNPYRVQANSTGKYSVRLFSASGSNFDRYDVTVTSSDLISPDPTGSTGITGRVSAINWYYNACAFTEATSADTDYFVLTNGGFPNTNFVWKLDLNNLSGCVYNISSNRIGVNPPRSGFTTAISGNSLTPEFPQYLAYPAVAGPRPSTPPTITNFHFLDDSGGDIAFSPGVTVGVQDSGDFIFTTDTDEGTFAIAIDVDQDGTFGDEGDVWLIGGTVIGQNSVRWNGTDVTGVTVPPGNYTAKLSVRLGEFHFVGEDIETSGGSVNASNPANGHGLTVFEATAGGGTIPTRVFLGRPHYHRFRPHSK